MDDDMKQAILIVDDAETDIDTLVETLGDDYDIAVALDGPSALQVIGEQPPDLVLLDILMEKNAKGQTVNRVESIFQLGTSQMDNEECAVSHQMLRSLGVVHLDHQARI